MDIVNHYEFFDVKKYLYTSTPDFTEYRIPKNITIDMNENLIKLIEKYRHIEIRSSSIAHYNITFYHKDKSQQFQP